MKEKTLSMAAEHICCAAMHNMDANLPQVGISSMWLWKNGRMLSDQNFLHWYLLQVQQTVKACLLLLGLKLVSQGYWEFWASPNIQEPRAWRPSLSYCVSLILSNWTLYQLLFVQNIPLKSELLQCFASWCRTKLLESKLLGVKLQGRCHIRLEIVPKTNISC